MEVCFVKMPWRRWGYRKMRYIVLYFGSVDRPDLERLKDRLNVEVYRLDGPDLEDQIELALLNDLEAPLKLAYVGGEEAKQFDGQYSGVWVPDGPDVEADLQRLWECCRTPLPTRVK